jgi:dynamin GTPase
MLASLQINTFADNSDAVLLVVIPATSCRDVAVSRALKLAQDLDPDGTRTVGVISKVDQAASDQRSLAAVQALLSGQGPSATLEVPWVAMIGQSVAIAAAHSGAVSADDTLETAWKAEMESLKSILNGASPSKLGRIALVDTLGRQIRKRMKQRLPNILSGYVAACPRCNIGLLDRRSILYFYIKAPNRMLIICFAARCWI